MARFINSFTDVGFKRQRLPFKARNALFRRLEQIVDIAALSKEDRMKYDESCRQKRQAHCDGGNNLKVVYKQ